MGSQPNVEEILDKFVRSFVIIFETYLDEYHKRLVEKIPKVGKTAENLTGAANILTGVTEIFDGLTKAASLVTFQVFQKTVAFIGSKCNRDDLKKLSNKLRDYKRRPECFQDILIDSGFEIFRSFESQFTRLTTDDNCWESAMEKVAHDVVNRVINHLKKNPEKDFSVETIFEGVIFGQSNVYRSPNSDFSNLFRGHSVIVDGFELKTSDMFKKVGLLQDNSYYRYKSKTWGNPDLNCVGFRILYAWEDVTPDQNYTKLVQAPPGVYKNILTDEILQKVRPKVVDQLEDAQIELGDLKHILEDMRNDADREADELKDLLRMNAEAVAEAVEYISGEFKNINKTLDIIQQTTSKSNETIEVNHGILLQLLAKDENLQGNKKQFEDPIIFDIMEPTVLFNGRIDKLEELDKSFQRRDASRKKSVFPQMTCVSGLGGMGKSEMAKRYISDCRLNSPYILSKFKHFIWINAESEASLTDSFQRLAEEELGIRIINENGNKLKEIDRIVNDVYKCLKTQEDCLVVLDNAENQQYLRRFLPLKVTDGNLLYFLLTSRDIEWGDKRIEKIHLEQMKVGEAAGFVKDGLEYENDCEDIEIKELVETLQYFPLAIQQAISYILVQKEKHDNYSVGDYLKEFKDKAQEMLNSDKFKMLVMDNVYSETTFTTWNMTVDKIQSYKEHGGLAVDILNIMAYLSAEKIQRELFFELPLISEGSVREAVSLLIRYSMVKGECKQSVLRIHRLVQQVTRIKLGMKDDKSVIQTVRMLLNSNFREGVISESYKSKKNLLPHLEAFYVHLKDWIVRKPEDQEEIERTYLIEKLVEIAVASTLLGKSWRAKQVYEDVLTIIKKRNGKDDLIYAAIVSVELCTVLDDLGEYKIQLQIIEEILPILKEYYSYNEDYHFANALEKKAVALTKLGKCDQAEETFKIMLSLYEKSGNALSIARTKLNLCSVYAMKGNIQEQKRMLDEAIPVFEANYGSDHIDFARLQVVKANVHRALDEYDTEIGLLESALPIHKEVLGEHAHFVGRILLLLGVAYGNKGNQEKHKEYTENAFNIFKNHYRDEHHIEVARVKTYFADAVGESGDKAEQLRLLLSALTGYDAFHVDGSWETASLLVRIAAVQDNLGQRSECKETLMKAVAMKEKHLRNGVEKDQASLNRIKNLLSSNYSDV